MADLAWYWWAAIIGAIAYMIWYFAGEQNKIQIEIKLLLKIVRNVSLSAGRS